MCLPADFEGIQTGVAASPSDCLTCRRRGLFLRPFDPQEAHLGAEVQSVPDVGKEGLRVAGSAGRDAGPLRHGVVVDVFRQDAASLKENPEAAGSQSVLW